MRQYYFLGLFVFLFFSCQRAEYMLNVSANVDDKQQLYLIALDENNQPQTLDTLYIEQGITSYSGSIKFPEMHYLLMQGNRDVVPVILEPGTIAVEIYKDSIRKSTVGGTKSNKEFKRYVNESTPLVDDLFAIQNEMRNAMLFSLLVYLLSFFTLDPLLGNHGLWLSLMIYFLARGVSLAWYLPRISAT